MKSKELRGQEFRNERREQRLKKKNNLIHSFQLTRNPLVILSMYTNQIEMP